jgi:hypothetical protein
MSGEGGGYAHPRRQACTGQGLGDRRRDGCCGSDSAKWSAGQYGQVLFIWAFLLGPCESQVLVVFLWGILKPNNSQQAIIILYIQCTVSSHLQY